jgi:predicted RNA methylase
LAVKTRQISAEVRDVLAGIEWEGEVAKLPPGQLDRKLYQAVNDALESLGGKWNKKLKGHLFDADASLELESLIETGEYRSPTDVKQTLGQFDTPEWLADNLIRHADLKGGHRVLEPSAGVGNLIRAALKTEAAKESLHFTAIELDASRAMRVSLLIDVHSSGSPNWTLAVTTGDFLVRGSDAGPFDRVIMNPPFAKQVDVDHVLKAWELVKPGGRLVAIMSPGWTFRTNAKSREFRELVAVHGEYEPNPEGSFTEAGTGVGTVTVILDKPLS